MVAILEIKHASALRLSHQVRHHALPDPTPLVFQQPPITGLGGRANVVRQVLPAAPRVQDIQNPIEHLPLIFAGAARASRRGTEPFESVPLGIGDIERYGLRGMLPSVARHEFRQQLPFSTMKIALFLAFFEF